MKRRLILIFVTIAAFFCLAFGLIACGTKDGIDEGGKDPAQEHTHTYTQKVTSPNYLKASATCTDAAVYYYSCTCGDKGEDTFTSGVALGHTEEIVPGRPADCESEGLSDGKVCTVCHAVLVEQEVIPVAHTLKLIKGYAATCDTDGLTDGTKCSVCKKIITKQTVIPAAHKPGDWVIDKSATCSENGIKHRDCSVCSERLETQEIPLAPHAEQTIAGRAPTCTATGLTDGKKCSVCQSILEEQRVIPAKGHSYKNGTCTDCGETEPTAAILSVTGAQINGANIAMTVPSGTVDVPLIGTVAVSSGATWKLYDNKSCRPQYEIPSKIAANENGSLDSGDNVFYILVTSPDGNSSNIYTFTIYLSYAVDVRYYDGATLLKTERAYTGYEYATAYTPDITGYTFNKWKKADDSDYTTSVLYGALELFADKTANRYNAGFVTDDKTTPVAECSYAYDSEVTLPTPQKTGYRFDGWYDGSNVITGAFTWKYTAATQFTARFTAKSFDINYDAAGGTVTGGDTQPVTFDCGYTLRDVTRNGYRFDGYTYNGEPFTSGTYTIDGGITIRATWSIITYTITYHAEVAVDGSAATEYTAESADIALPVLSMANHVFDGWYTDSAYTNKKNSIPAGSYGDLDLYAKFSPETYTYTFNANGGRWAPEDISKTYGVDICLPVATPSRSDYLFCGWNAVGLPSVYKAGEQLDVERDVTFYAMWAAACTHCVRIDDEYMCCPTCKGKKYIERYESCWMCSGQGYLESFARCDNCDGRGWLYTEYIDCVRCNKAGQIKYNCSYCCRGYVYPTAPTVSGISYNVVTLTPADGYEYCVSRDKLLLNGEGEWQSSNVFAGLDYGETYYFYRRVAATDNAPFGVISLSCKAIVSELAISYVLNGGTNSSSNPSTYATSSAPVTLKDPTRKGYMFVGWTGSNGTTPQKGVVIPERPDSELSYTANWQIITYTITYHLDGGTNNASNPDTYTVANYKTLASPTKEYYTFDGWYTESTFTNKVTYIASGSTGNKVFYAKWTPTGYTVTYELNGGTNNSSNPDTYTIESSTITLASPSKTGYTFGGWYTDSGFTDKVTGIAAGSTGNKTFYAKWTPTEYTITYVLNGGTNNASNPGTYTIESSRISLLNPSKTGYTFGGWYTNSAFTGSRVFYILSGSTGNRAVYAKWTIVIYDITYVVNGSTNDTSNPATYTIESSAIALASPSKTGYDFGGWYSNSALTNSVTSIAAGSSGNRTLYAKWTPTVYTITYNLDGGVNNVSNPATYTIESSTITLASPSRTGYDFGGWYTDGGFTTGVTAIENGSIGNRTFYAKWTLTDYTITYNLDGGVNNASNPATYTIESSAITLASPSKTGYDFGGWYSNSALTNSVTSIAVGSSGNKTFYAKWTPTVYTITYNLDGGVNNASNPATYTIESSTITLASPSRTGYDFDGWYTDGEFTTGVTAIENGSTGNRTVYAKWTIVIYDITYVVNGGTNDTSNPDTYTVEGDAIVFASPTRAHYDFLGWYSDAGFTDRVTGIEAGSAGDKTVYAKWAAISYDLTYVLRGKTFTVSSIAYDSTFTVLNVMSGYETKWEDEDGRTLTSGDNITYDYDGATVFTATEVICLEDSDFTVTVAGGGAQITGYNGTDTVVYVADYYRNNNTIYPITLIGDSAFSSKSEITSISLGGDIAGIGSSAFYECSALADINLPDGITSIGSSAFYGCESLAAITLPLGLTEIGEKAFSGCASLVEITVPDSVTTIGSSLFENCSSLGFVTLGDGLTSIDSGMFNGCRNIMRMTLGRGISSIASQSNFSCKIVEIYNLSGLNIKAGSTYNGMIAYWAKHVYTSTDTPSKLYMDEDGFVLFDNGNSGRSLIGYCGKQTHITLPETINGYSYDTIYDTAFYYNSRIVDVTLPDNVTTVKSSAFSNCSELEGIHFGAGVTSFSSDAFRVTPNLKYMTVSADNTKYYSDGNCIIENDTLKLACNNSVIPTSGKIKYIGSEAFYGRDITDITIPDGVTTIQSRAFVYCRDLTSITISSSVKDIYNEAFSYCNALTDVYYTGTEEQWNAINIFSSGFNGGNNCLINATIHYNYVPA